MTKKRCFTLFVTVNVVVLLTQYGLQAALAALGASVVLWEAMAELWEAFWGAYLNKKTHFQKTKAPQGSAHRNACF